MKLVLRLLSDADFLAAHAEGILDADEQRLLLWEKAPRGCALRGGRRRTRC